MTGAQRHLDDQETLSAATGGTLSAASAEHLSSCPDCQADIDFVAGLGDHATTAPAVSVPALATEAADGDVAPERGELWRVRWHEVAELAVVWLPPRPWVRSFPASTDLGFGDDRTVRLGDDDSNLGPLEIWVGLGVDLPIALFERKLGQVTSSAIDTIAIYHHANTSGETADGINVGAPITSRLDDRFEYRNILSDRFTTLADSVLAGERTDPDRYAAAARDASDQRRGRRG
jgi:hypothetical protein